MPQSKEELKRQSVRLTPTGTVENLRSSSVKNLFKRILISLTVFLPQKISAKVSFFKMFMIGIIEHFRPSLTQILPLKFSEVNTNPFILLTPIEISISLQNY